LDSLKNTRFLVESGIIDTTEFVSLYDSFFEQPADSIEQKWFNYITYLESLGQRLVSIPRQVAAKRIVLICYGIVKTRFVEGLQKYTLNQRLKEQIIKLGMYYEDVQTIKKYLTNRNVKKLLANMDISITHSQKYEIPRYNLEDLLKKHNVVDQVVERLVNGFGSAKFQEKFSKRDLYVFVHPELLILQTLLEKHGNVSKHIIGVSKACCFACTEIFNQVRKQLNVKVSVSNTCGKICGVWNFPGIESLDMSFVHVAVEKKWKKFIASNTPVVQSYSEDEDEEDEYGGLTFNDIFFSTCI
jgi:hypothetical protein